MEKEGPLENDIVDGLTPNPHTGMLMSEGHEYWDTPRMRAFFKRATIIRNGLPPLQDGYSRLWRGNRPGEVGSNPSFTNSLEGIALPFLKGYGGKLSYVDVPTTDLEKYEEKVGAASGSEFTLPAELASGAVAIEETPEPL
jgi:hypothetical protein